MTQEPQNGSNKEAAKTLAKTRDEAFSHKRRACSWGHSERRGQSDHTRLPSDIRMMDKRFRGGWHPRVAAATLPSAHPARRT